MPQAHYSEREKVAHDRCRVHASEPFAARSRKQESHVNVVAKPERKRDMPAVPKITDISREKWSTKIFGCVNAEEIADSDGESAVSSEVEKQIKTIGIHVAEQRTDAVAARGKLEPVSLDQRSEYELVE